MRRQHIWGVLTFGFYALAIEPRSIAQERSCEQLYNEARDQILQRFHNQVQANHRAVDVVLQNLPQEAQTQLTRYQALGLAQARQQSLTASRPVANALARYLLESRQYIAGTVGCPEGYERHSDIMRHQSENYQTLMGVNVRCSAARVTDISQRVYFTPASYRIVFPQPLAPDQILGFVGETRFNTAATFFLGSSGSSRFVTVQNLLVTSTRRVLMDPQGPQWVDQVFGTVHEGGHDYSLMDFVSNFLLPSRCRAQHSSALRSTSQNHTVTDSTSAK